MSEGRRQKWVLAAAIGLWVASVGAQAPDFSGTWRLDEAKSSVVATAGIIGLIPAGAPKTLHVTQSANGTIVVESQINEAHVRIYRPGRDTSTPAGQGGAIRMRSAWEGRTLVADGALRSANGDTTTVRERMAVSADGRELVVEVAANAASSRMVYTKITDVGSCETWPTPCKPAP